MITATLVPENKRLDFLPAKFPQSYLQFEIGCYSKLSALSEDYVGGFWNYYELSNGGVYIAPDDDDKKFRIVVPSNGYEGTASADAAGIIVSLFSINALCWIQPCEKHNDLYYALRDYAVDHPEGAVIYGAID